MCSFHAVFERTTSTTLQNRYTAANAASFDDSYFLVFYTTVQYKNSNQCFQILWVFLKKEFLRLGLLMAHQTYKSTLFNETGNIELYRITEETKKKGVTSRLLLLFQKILSDKLYAVANDSKRIHDQMIAANAKSRERFRQEENSKIRVRNLIINTTIFHKLCAAKRTKTD